MCRMLDKVDRRRPSLYCILFGFVTFVRLRSRGPAQRRSPRRPVGLASQVLWRETGACASPCDRPIDCCELGRKRHARYKMAGILHVQAPAEVAHSHGMYRRPSTKQRAPGSWCDWGGLSHSGDPHTTMYRLSLPSVEHAGCAELHTRQSRTGLATVRKGSHQSHGSSSTTCRFHATALGRPAIQGCEVGRRTMDRAKSGRYSRV